MAKYHKATLPTTRTFYEDLDAGLFIVDTQRCDEHAFVFKYIYKVS